MRSLGYDASSDALVRSISSFWMRQADERVRQQDTRSCCLDTSRSFDRGIVTSYAPRYDMIAVTAHDRVLLPTIFSPKDREAESAKGINGKMLLKFIDDVLAQAVEGLNRYPITLVLDRATIHKNTAAIFQAFHDRSCYAIKDIIILPPLTAKRLSPLDNSIFSVWKRECHERGPLTKQTIKRVMNDAWSHINPFPFYQHCGLTGHRDVYFDCPDPLNHKHPKKRKGEDPPLQRSVRPRRDSR